MITVHRSLKSEDVKLLIVLAVSPNLHADYTNGIKSVHWQSILLLPFISFKRKPLEGCRACCKISFFVFVFNWHVGKWNVCIYMQQTERQCGVSKQTFRLWLHCRQTTGTVSVTGLPSRVPSPSNNLAAVIRSLSHTCMILASNSLSLIHIWRCRR